MMTVAPSKRGSYKFRAFSISFLRRPKRLGRLDVLVGGRCDEDISGGVSSARDRTDGGRSLRRGDRADAGRQRFVGHFDPARAPRRSAAGAEVAGQPTPVVGQASWGRA